MGTILIVEDDRDIRELLAELFIEERWRVHCLTNGLHVVEAVRELQPDLVLLDLVLPGRDGLDVLDDLRGHRATARVPVVVTSAACIAREDVPAADGFLRKPFAADELLALVEGFRWRPGPGEVRASL